MEIKRTLTKLLRNSSRLDSFDICFGLCSLHIFKHFLHLNVDIYFFSLDQWHIFPVKIFRLAKCLLLKKKARLKLNQTYFLSVLIFFSSFASFTA